MMAWLWSKKCKIGLAALTVGCLIGLGMPASQVVAAESGAAPDESSAPEAEVASDDTGQSPDSAESEAEKPKDYREGWGFAGLPLANFNSDDGFGYGVKVAGYDYGKNQKPYKTMYAIQLFFTTRHVNYHRLFFDAPRLFGSPWRLDSVVKWDKVLLSNYFGVGNDVPKPETDSIGDTSGLSEEEKDAQSERVNNYYTSFQTIEPIFIVNLRRDLRGPLKFYNGYLVKYTQVTPHSAETLAEYADIEVDDDWTSYLEETRPYGYGGGTLGCIQLGIVIDSRNREPSPDRGFFTDISARAAYYSASDSADADAGSPLYSGVNLTNRFFIPMTSHLVLATRVVADVLFGDVPFYELATFGGAQYYTGLGGDVSMRGVKSRRYRGKVKVLLTPELRFTPFEFYGWKQKFNLGFAAYYDVGRVWKDLAADGDLLNLHSAVGGGFRFAWNDNFLIRFDMGKDIEAGDLGVYLTFDHAF